MKIKKIKLEYSYDNGIGETEIDIDTLRKHITNLQEEIERQEKAQVILDNQNAKLQERINKANEYIDNHTIEWVDKQFKESNVMVAFNEYSNPQALKNILNGEDNENN